MFIIQETGQTLPDQTFNVTLATPFGIIHLPAESRMSKLDVDLENIAVVEPVGTIIMKSVTRSITLFILPLFKCIFMIHSTII